jgi:hypothetical protein
VRRHTYQVTNFNFHLLSSLSLSPSPLGPRALRSFKRENSIEEAAFLGNHSTSPPSNVALSLSFSFSFSNSSSFSCSISFLIIEKLLNFSFLYISPSNLIYFYIISIFFSYFHWITFLKFSSKILIQFYIIIHLYINYYLF